LVNPSNLKRWYHANLSEARSADDNLSSSQKVSKKAPPIEEVRRILRGIDGELSDDILKERDEEWR